MTKFHYTRKAIDNLSNIWSYTADKWSENQAKHHNRMDIKINKRLT